MALSVVLVAAASTSSLSFFLPPFLSLFAKYVLGLQKFGEIVVNFAFLFEIGHDFFVETSAMVTEIW